VPTRTFRPAETVYCRFTREVFTVIGCNGCVATLRDSAGNITGRIVGELTRGAQMTNPKLHAEDYFDHVAALRLQGLKQDGSPIAIETDIDGEPRTAAGSLD
jgi:hypothetical protein